MARVERRLRRKGGLSEGLIERGRVDDSDCVLCSSSAVPRSFWRGAGRIQRPHASVVAADGRARRPRRSPRSLPRRPAAARSVPARLLIGVCTVLAGALIARLSDIHDGLSVTTFIVSLVASVVVCEHVLPMLIVRRDPEEVLDVILPVFHPVAQAADADDSARSFRGHRCSSRSPERHGGYAAQQAA